MRQLRSAQVTQGVERAPARSLFYAMGYTKEELDRPLIGVVSAHSEIVPGHFNLDKITEGLKGATGVDIKEVLSTKVKSDEKPETGNQQNDDYREVKAEEDEAAASGEENLTEED